MTDDLETWLRAQLDEDEREAQKQPDDEDYPIVGLSAEMEQNYPCSRFLRIPKSMALADIAAKRAILDLHPSTAGYVYDDDMDREPGSVCRTCAWPSEYGGELGDSRPYPCQTLRLLAAAYADRPGYQDEWRPA